MRQVHFASWPPILLFIDLGTYMYSSFTISFATAMQCIYPVYEPGCIALFAQVPRSRELYGVDIPGNY